MGIHIIGDARMIRQVIRARIVSLKRGWTTLICTRLETGFAVGASPNKRSLKVEFAVEGATFIRSESAYVGSFCRAKSGCQSQRAQVVKHIKRLIEAALAQKTSCKVVGQLDLDGVGDRRSKPVGSLRMALSTFKQWLPNECLPSGDFASRIRKVIPMEVQKACGQPSRAPLAIHPP